MKYPIKETSLLTISSVVTRIIAVLFSIVLARTLSVSDFGLFRYLATVSTFYAVLCAGMPMAITKFIGEDVSNKELAAEYLTNALMITLVLFFIMVAAILAFDSHKTFLILFLFAILIDSVYLGFVRGLLDYTKLIGFKLVENIIQLLMLVGCYLVFQKINLGLAVIFFSFAGVFSLIAFEIHRPEFRIVLSISKQRAARLIKYSIPVVLGSIGWTIMFGVNTVFIERLCGTEAVAYYSVALTIAQVFSFLPDSVATITMPKVAGIKDRTKIAGPLRLSVLGSLVISILMLIPLLLFKDFILTTIFSKSYSPAIGVILPISVSSISIGIHQIYASVWQGLERPGVPSITISVAAGLNVIGSYFLTKSYGINGAALSIAATSLMALALISGYWARWSRTMGLSPNLRPGLVDTSK